MHIYLADTTDEFEALRRDWDAVYEADPEAQFFLSWQWLSDWLTVHQSVWFVLAAKRNETDTEHVAFLPLRIQAVFDRKNGFFNELVFAGTGYSDYTGILVRPELEAEVVPAFAEYLKRKLNWARFTMDNLMMSARRRRLFLRPFDKIRFVHKPIEYKSANDPTNHGVCLSINLPGDWEKYLETLSTNNRQKIRRLLRKIDAAGDYRIKLSDGSNFDQNLRILLDWWKIKWAPRKGREISDEIALRNYHMLSRCAQNNTLLLPVFWHGDKPVAALATLVDPCKKSLLFFITGRDETYREVPAGYLLHAYSIRHAIAHGFATYDFLKGNEPYKYLFGPQNERRQKAVSVATKTHRNLGGRLDPRGVPAMLDIALQFAARGETDNAEAGYREILKLEPDHALALYRFGRLMAENGAHAEAKELLSRSVAAEPEGDIAWLWLARTLQALGEDQAALDACQQVVNLQPDNKDGRDLILQLKLAAEPAGQSTNALAPGSRPSPARHAFKPPLTPEAAEALRYLAARYPS